MDKVLKRLTDVGHERRLQPGPRRQRRRASRERQVPTLYAAYLRGAALPRPRPDTPPLYVDPDAVRERADDRRAPPDGHPVLRRCPQSYEPDEVDGDPRARARATCSSEHYYYTTALVLLAQFLRTSVPGSADRAPDPRDVPGAPRVVARRRALRRTGRAPSSMGDPLVVCRTLMRTGGRRARGHGASTRSSPRQSDYEEEEDLFARWSRAWVEIALTHPFAVRRVRELISLGRVGRLRPHPRRQLRAPRQRAAAVQGVPGRRRALPRAFSSMLERTTGGVQRLVGQLEDWLRGTRRRATARPRRRRLAPDQSLRRRRRGLRLVDAEQPDLVADVLGDERRRVRVEDLPAEERRARSAR